MDAMSPKTERLVGRANVPRLYFCADVASDDQTTPYRSFEEN